MARAVVATGYGPPTVLQSGEVEVRDPGPAQIRVAVRFAGVGPTDLAIRAGHLREVYPLPPGGVLGFEAAGTVEAVGADVADVSPGDEVAVFLNPTLGGYAELVLADFWVRKPASVGWAAAAALPASAEAAIRVLNQLGIGSGETLLLLGGAGSVGTIATQIAVARGVKVISAVRPVDFAAAEAAGATPVDFHRPLAEAVPAVAGRIDAVMDASGRSDLEAAIELAGGAKRVITLSDPRGPSLGVALSGPVPEYVRDLLAEAMGLLATGRLRLRERTVLPLAQAADAHARLESGELRGKILLRI
ncbi:NADP-dependent oxidoreductase [Actinoplanes sp. KI2]|uniref:NADP-dependent oxidoreductase n=1 Tax=Actinoplanes sp. KI2 TaxID=2983315 RepID=UPI0021D5BCF5|nr:NADP-dependent oxidoreductase [Actinoplanes sp. KI2]MCU7728342.1 NADP-dependent oxidoreductase [Actinoplanes sp. KI2]